MRNQNLLSLTFILFLLVSACQPADQSLQTTWTNDVERTWIGPDFWANRLQDWQVANGRIQTTEQASGKPLRTLHLLTRRLGEGGGNFSISVNTGWLDPDNISEDAAIGFLIGAGGDLDYRAAALIHHSPGQGMGLFAGIDATGQLVFTDLNSESGEMTTGAALASTDGAVTITLEGAPEADGHALTLTVSNGSGARQVLTYSTSAPLHGNTALVASLDRAWFTDWQISGSKVIDRPEDNAGPVLSTQYTLSENILKMTAQLMPVGSMDNQAVRLETQSGDTWETVATANIITPGYTVPFRVENWDDTRDTPYRVAYDLTQADGSSKTYYWSGEIKQDPKEREVVSVAGFTGNHNTARGVESGAFLWNEYIWFPHNDIVNSVKQLNVDVLFFSGDQIYEGASPTFPDRANAELDYLYKWYLWAWAFRDITKDRPTVTIPDDHDVYQGNIWGHGGRATDKDDKGGYVMPAEWVKMVERTQTSHLPDPYDPTPIDQGIGVYYTGMTYGRLGFAILEDRKFKHGCAGIIPGKEGRPDHFANADFDPSIVELPGLKLLGDRQLAFLDDWTANWSGHDMKLALSQTVFANMATHHGGNLMRLYGDLDSNGWPKRGRDRAIGALRKGFTFMLAGDQHLSTIVHHGIDAANDAGYSFCVPSIANFYPRGWNPESIGKNRPAGAPEHLGEHQDAFGNYVTVYGATNPTALTGQSTGVTPLELHDKMPGFGVVRFNKTDRTITMENWPRYVDPADPSSGSQYEGWPKTIHMEDNYGREAVAYLPTIEVTGMTDPVVQVVNEASGEIVYTLRIDGNSYRPKVFAAGMYTVRVGEEGQMQDFTSIEASSEEQARTLSVSF